MNQNRKAKSKRTTRKLFVNMESPVTFSGGVSRNEKVKVANQEKP